MQKSDFSVFSMVHQVLAESKEKLASESSGLDKTAAVDEPKQQPVSDYSEFLKIADACDHLSGHLHVVIDERSPQEKLAEYAEIQEALRKEAFSIGNSAPDEPSQNSDAGDNSTGPHQTQTANPDSQSPKTVSLDSSGTGVGGSDAVPSEETDTPGTSLDAGQSGEATGAHQSPKSVQPTEKPNPQDAANAVETNKGMMMPEQPVNLLKQSAAEKSPTLRGLIDRKRGNVAQNVKLASVLLHKAASAGVPANVTLAMIRTRCGDEIAKMAEDALNPAKISGGTEPELQSEPGVPSQLSQGSEVGSNTPRETAPTSGEGSGRELLSTVEAAINATKAQAKRQNKSALNEVLTEPAMSAAHDKTLQESLDNTSSAGVKISSAQAADAARELLRRFQDSSPVNHQKLAALAKLAQDPDMAAAGGGVAPEAGAPAPEDEIGDNLEAEEPEGVEGPSEEAIEAAQAGVTPEELAEAAQLLEAEGALAEEAAAAEGGEEAGAGGPPEGVPPAAGEKESQGMGMGSMGGAPSAPMM